MKLEVSKNQTMRVFNSGREGFIGSHFWSRLFFRKNVERVMVLTFTSWERAGSLAVAAIRFDCTKIKSRSWRTSDDGLNDTILEEVSYA